jgi:alpha-L-fucosidase
MRKLVSLLIISLLLVPATFQIKSQEYYQPAPENLEAREWFQDAKFGLFVHWGAYSVMAGGGEYGIAEWIMEQKKIPVYQYEKIPHFFNPVAFNPAEWVSLVREAGMKYITITSKHHDGFAMYNSRISDYDVVERTPYGKDILGQLKEECDKQGIKLFFYYSQLDWHNTDYYPRGWTGNSTGRPESGNWDSYIDYMNAQLSELLTGYGEVGGIWFDGMWDKWDARWRLEETYALIHKLQPQALIGSNHHKLPFPGEDFQMFEKDLPGQNTAGFNQTGISQLPLETCETMNDSWGFNLRDNRFKSTRDLIHLLLRAAGQNSNLLLNTGPMPDGRIQPESVRILKEMGVWMDRYGETVYNTRGGPAGAKTWGVTTMTKDKIFVHVLDAEDPVLYVPLQGRTVKKAYSFENKEQIIYKKQGEGILVNLPDIPPDLIDYIIVLEL